MGLMKRFLLFFTLFLIGAVPCEATPQVRTTSALWCYLPFGFPSLEANKLHFDIKHLNTLGWTARQDLADSLAKCILAVVGQGPDLIIR
jgi:hypothetical protein